jgi:hypothetical protein
MDPELLRFIKRGINEFGDNFKDDKFVMQFLPIFLVFLFSLYSSQFIEVGNSVLGKLFAVVIIIYYTKLNILYGVFACVVFILFYQLSEGVVEGMKSKKKKYIKIDPPKNKVDPTVPAVAAAATTATTTTQKEDPEDVEDGTNMPDDAEDGTNMPDDNDAEGFEPYQSLYPVISTEDFNVAKEEFIKEKCRNGVVMYKDMPVKPEMVDHVFSEIHFTTKTKCNPCDRTCAYSIIESKLATEEELGRPKNSNDFFDFIKGFFEPKRDAWKEPQALRREIFRGKV